MNRTRLGGLALAGTGILGYVVGTVVPYTGRGFTITAVMVGITLIAVGGAE